MRRNLVSWQRSLYPDGHRDRTNLAIHVVTVPVFASGLVALAVGLVTLSPWVALSGLAAAVLAIAAQGRGHARETTRPVPFEGPIDVVTRILTEQLITFPRFVLSGDFARAWREAGRGRSDRPRDGG